MVSAALSSIWAFGNDMTDFTRTMLNVWMKHFIRLCANKFWRWIIAVPLVRPILFETTCHHRELNFFSKKQFDLSIYLAKKYIFDSIVNKLIKWHFPFELTINLNVKRKKTPTQCADSASPSLLQYANACGIFSNDWRQQKIRRCKSPGLSMKWLKKNQSQCA